MKVKFWDISSEKVIGKHTWFETVNIQFDGYYLTNKDAVYYILLINLVRSLTTGKSQTEALMYWPSDSEVNTFRLRSEISL